MIDLHCHILHGLDDGPESAAESMRMARVFEQSGYLKVAAIPHMVPGTSWMPSTEQIHTGIAKMITSGVYLQVNWGSFLGQYGRSV